MKPLQFRPEGDSNRPGDVRAHKPATEEVAWETPQARLHPNECPHRGAPANAASLTEERERFLSAAYHDLQQPLSIIGLYSRLAQSKLDHDGMSSLRNDLLIIENAAQDIGAMFRGVRDVWELGRVPPTIETVDLGELLNEIARELSCFAQRKALSFRVRRSTAHPCRVQTDRTQLKRALSNLAANAIKYTPEGGVLIGAVRLRSKVRIDVWDTGVGIPEEFQRCIFDEHVRLRQPGDSHCHGLGLGLSIVRQIASNLPEHRLTFRSIPGRGSRFSLEVPLAYDLAAYSQPLAVSSSFSPPNLEGKYIVVVDNEQLLLDGIVQSLETAGCIAEGAESFEKARELFEGRDRCPDLLIVDLRLGNGANGLKAIASLRERFEWAGEIPVLFSTGELVPAAVLSDFEGHYDIYPKPFHPESLLRRVAALLNLHPARLPL